MERAPGSAARVVVVNDDADAAEILARILEADGHEVRRAHGQDEAAEMVASEPPDLIVIDLAAAGAGVRLLEAVRTGPDEASRTVGAIVIGAGPANALLCWQSGADGVLARPFAATALQELVAEVLARPAEARAGYRAAAQASLQSSPGAT
ncbi:MAG: two-component system sensor histidine kinase/response regulator [Acidimicrobiales bacterium]|nr:two-component system sensor histidine kinase/response regulator [Acidimicrobiales bacterium]